MEKSPSDITLFARLGFLIYIDGYTARIASMRPSTNQHGDDVWFFILDPSDELIKRHNLKPNRNGNMLYETELPFELIISLNDDPSWKRYFCLLTFDGTETFASRKLKGFSQQKRIMELKKEILVEKMLRENAVEEAQLIKSNLPKYMKMTFEPMMENILPFMDKVMNKEQR